MTHATYDDLIGCSVLAPAFGLSCEKTMPISSTRKNKALQDSVGQ